MIQPANVLSELSDEEFADYSEKADKKIRGYLNDNLLYDFFAYLLSENYHSDLIPDDCLLRSEYNLALNFLSNVKKYDELDINKFKKIIKEKYSLNLTSIDPIRIEEIK